MPTQGDAQAALISELGYQEAMMADPSRPDILAVMPAGNAILAMEHCLAEARKAWYSGAGDHPAAAEYIRKVTALGFRFMMDHSAPRRTGY